METSSISLLNETERNYEIHNKKMLGGNKGIGKLETFAKDTKFKFESGQTTRI